MNKPPFDTVLIANRGEIACRIITTCKRLGIRTVAVYSQADAQARHVRMADVAVPIGPAPARESYLVAEKILDAARQTGAHAIHPGYGFLSENAAFARACAEAGIVFIGPPPEAIEAMGSKSAAKALMEKAGVPLTPGYHGDEQSPRYLHARADAIGYPVLIKASAGGGGKGMRRVDRSEDFLAALESCRREASSAFGDTHVLIEKYVLRPRHVEIQIFADTQGHCVHLFERDCSVQRRHQKVLEEAPAPGMTAARRAAMGQAAIDAARAVGYVGAGTVEFIASPEGDFYFMEMNTRLQVEHPVTEMITGQDLVEWQLRVAAGEALPLAQHEIGLYGHAIEARLYAEDAQRGFLPSVGRLALCTLPQGPGIRVDTGVERGDAVSPHYDPMIAKLIVHGANRTEALARMRTALSECAVVGVTSNLDFLQRLLAEEGAFARAELDTGLIEREQARLFPEPVDITPRQIALASLARVLDEAIMPATPPDPADPHSPWNQRHGWRLGAPAARRLRWRDGDHLHLATLHADGEGWTIQIKDQRLQLQGQRMGVHLRARIDGHWQQAIVFADGDALHLFDGGTPRILRLDDPLAAAHGSKAGAGDLAAPMPGRVVAVLADPGPVTAGQPLLVLEAMKMEHTITAPAAGQLRAVVVSVGEQVAEGAALVDFEPEPKA